MPAIGTHVSKLSGYVPELPTPFDNDDRVDEKAFERLCDAQMRNGAAALAVCGVTGEAPNLTYWERGRLIDIAVDVAQGRVPVLAGADSNATETAVKLAKQAQAHGASAVLTVVPYYNRPTQAGLYEHFRTIATLTYLPVIMCDAPSLTGRALADETIARLMEFPRIVGLKDAGGDTTRPTRLRSLIGPDFRLFAGEDATVLSFLANGGDGCISVTSNVAPALCRDMFLAWQQWQNAKALQLAWAIGVLTGALLLESSPAPLKYVLGLFGLMQPRVRLPLVELSRKAKEDVHGVLEQLCDGDAGSLIGTLATRATALPRSSGPNALCCLTARSCEA